MKIRKAARTVFVDENNMIALINVRDGEYYKIPGGGIELGETEEQAAIRETIEETGCNVEIIKKIGENQFTENSPEYGETIHQSVCFLAKKIGDKNDTSFDEWEQSNNMKLIWVNINDAIKLFQSVNTNDNFALEINKRDFDFVLKAQKLL